LKRDLFTDSQSGPELAHKNQKEETETQDKLQNLPHNLHLAATSQNLKLPLVDVAYRHIFAVLACISKPLDFI